MIGRSLAQYKIIAKVGEGGMGQVYRAQDSRLGRDVAIKVLPEHLAADPDFLQRFAREARLLAGLNHPNIAAIHGFEEVDGLHFLVMELVEGENLSQLLKKGPVSLEETLSISRQIAEALDFAHQNGVVHRDLKPANVALTEDGKIKLLDFGLAKALEREGADGVSDLTNSPTELLSTPTASGVILGTAAYMSPEQARGKKVDKRTDIFAFGTVVYELLTGQILFGGETVSDILAAVLRADPDFDELPAGTPRALQNLLDRCLQKNPRRRLRDIGEACILLEDIQTGRIVDTPVAEAAASPGQRANRRVAVAGWLVAAVFLVALVVVGSRRAPAPVEETPRVLRQVIPLSNRDPSASQQFQPRISPDGKRVAYVSQNQLWVRDLSEIDARQMDGTEGAVAPFFSPDNEWIAFGIDNRLYRSRLDRNGLDLIATLSAEQRLSSSSRAVWQPDQQITFGTGATGLLGVSSRGGNATQWLAPADNEIDFHEVGLLPHGKGWLVIVHNNQGYGNIDLVGADHARRRILEIPDSIQFPVYSPSGHILFQRGGASAGIWAFDFSLETLQRTSEPFIVAPGGRVVSVSQDGTLCYLDGFQLAEARLTWYSRAGQPLGTLGTTARTTRPFPRISPDGRQVVCAIASGDVRELYLFDTASGNQRRLTFDQMQQEVADWFDDETLISYENNSYNLSRLGLDGTTKLLGVGILPSITPDRSEIIVSRTREHWDWDLVALTADGSQERVLIENAGVQWFGRVSPNGQYIAYQSDETGVIEVFVTTFPNASTRWQITTEGGEQPMWSSDGSELFFTTRSEIRRVAVRTDQGFRFDPPETLFERPSVDWSSNWSDGFDVSDDGQRFLMWTPEPLSESEPPRIVIVHNWFEEFRQN